MAKIFKQRQVIFVISGIILLTMNTSSEVQKGVRGISQKPIIIDRKKLDVNQISAWYRNDGEFHSDHSTMGPGFEWLKEAV